MQTRHSRELGRRVEQVVRDYQRDHPELTDAEIRAALAQSTLGVDDGADTSLRNRRVALVSIAAALGIAGAVVAATRSGGTVEGGRQWVFAILVAVAVVGIAVVRLSGRGRD